MLTMLAKIEADVPACDVPACGRLTTSSSVEVFPLSRSSCGGIKPLTQHWLQDGQTDRQDHLLQTEALVVRSKHSALQVDQRGGVWTQPGTGHGQVVPRQTLWIRLRTCRGQRVRAGSKTVLLTNVMSSPQLPSRPSLNNVDLKVTVLLTTKAGQQLFGSQI